MKQKNKSILFRKGLVVAQFSIAIVLLIGTTVIYLQLQYLQNKSWGYNPDQVVGIPILQHDIFGEGWLGFPERLSTTKHAFMNNPNVLSGTVSHITPPRSIRSIVRLENENIPRHLSYLVADNDFLKTFQIDLILGRNISSGLPRAFDEIKEDIPTEIVLNETAIKYLGLANPIGQQLVWIDQGNKPLTVVGVMRDFQNQNIHQKLEPMFLTRNGQPPLELSFRIRSDNISETIAFFKKTWKTLLPQKPFQYRFLQTQIERMYQRDKEFGQLCSIFALLSVFVASLGLFGLSTFATEQRIKEISIRKVLGASAHNIVILLSKDFLKPVIAANIIAWPFAYFIAKNWLADFAYRIELNIPIFILCGIVAFFIASISILHQAWKTARSNPIDALRNE